MKNPDKAEFLVALSSVAELFGKVLTDATIELWWSILKDVSLDDVKSGFSKHMRDPQKGHFMPMPADVIAQSVRPAKTGLEAWREVLHAMERVGSYQSVYFEDQVINSVIEEWNGWPWLCVQDIGEPWTQKEFERRYEAYASQGIRSNKHLAGQCEIVNLPNEDKFLAMGFTDFMPKPILIGDEKKRLQESNKRQLKAVT